MNLIKAEAMFKVRGARYVHKQQVKLRPNEHHYEEKGEAPYIKYTCQICEQIYTKYTKLNESFGDDEQFNKFALPQYVKQCPVCGINIDWDYKQGGGYYENETRK